MATRQYIGARYVPKFYENGVGSSEWTANTAYEPLTIVTRNGNSYTSKKEVPATAGAPEAAPEYWASTGIYNQQIDIYREEVADVAERVTAVESDLSLIKNRRFIFIGDSWFRYHSGNDYTHFMDMVYSALNLTQGSDYYEIAAGGYGFIGDENQGRTWLSLLQAATIADPETITDIYIFGGINDRPYTQAAIETAISSFAAYTKNRFPNAKIKLGCISWTQNSVYNGILRDTIIPAYRNCSKYGISYIPNMEYSAHIYSYLDGIHPTQSMQPFLFNAVMSAILSDRADIKYTAAGSRVSGIVSNVPAATMTLESAFTAIAPESMDGNLFVSLDNGITSFSVAQRWALTVASETIGPGYKKLGTLSGGLMYGSGAGKDVYIPVSVNVNNGTYVTGVLLIANGSTNGAEVYLSLNISNTVVTSLSFMQFSGAVSTLSV